jgi:hypothetical protein
MRTLLAAAATVALLGACGGDDPKPLETAEATTTTEDDATTTTTEAETTTTAGSPLGTNPCDLLTPSEIEGVTGFSVTSSGSNGVCSYVSEGGTSIITLASADTQGLGPQVLQGGRTVCDDGTDEDYDLGDGAFTCKASGAGSRPLVTVGVVFGDTFYTMAGIDTSGAVPDEAIQQALLELLALLE